ncbi:ATP-binding protein [Actinomadura sp. ATCC 31491]|uniref:ATP-binding protein n=1 Tax=Actinomadura luzonensis TaxID=2805427 RepID=A0ABT0FR64_9ACTN|nr:ATP-binding protein [Actinomadura luzonensis]MCK2214806.1 ATP-binding protein [Actinomadura luzonensis]
MTAEYELRRPGGADLGYVRRLVRAHAEHSGLAPERVEDLVLAANEAATNVLDHGGGHGRIAVREHDGDLVVEITDAGGRLREEHLAAADGSGLWVVRNLCDEVSVARNGAGSSLRLRMAKVREPAGPRPVATGSGAFGGGVARARTS